MNTIPVMNDEQVQDYINGGCNGDCDHCSTCGCWSPSTEQSWGNLEEDTLVQQVIQTSTLLARESLDPNTLYSVTINDTTIYYTHSSYPTEQEVEYLINKPSESESSVEEWFDTCSDDLPLILSPQTSNEDVVENILDNINDSNDDFPF